MLAEGVNLLEDVLDRPWPGCTVRILGLPLTWMSGSILSMLVVFLVLAICLPLMARKCRMLPRGGQNFLEALVVFVRDTIARPALHERADVYVSFLTTVFVFVFALNVVGLVPLGSIGLLAGLGGRYRVGGTPTATPAVGAALALLATTAILGTGLRHAAIRFHARHGVPMAVCWLLSPVLWFLSLSPPVPGAIGVAIFLPMAALELVSALAKCVALMVRLCSNMLAGHLLLAVLMMLGLEAIKPFLAGLPPTDPRFHPHGIYVLPVCVVSSAVLNVMEMVVAAIQAFIFTIMTALFLGMYAEAAH